MTKAAVAARPKEDEAAKPPAVQGAFPIRELTAAEAAELEGVGGAGLSDNVEDRGTPLLYIAQKMSRQVDSKRPEFVPGLEVGMAFNNLTNRSWDAENAGVPFLPCFFRANWLEWTPQDDGGGFHGSHPRDYDMRKVGAVPREGRRDIFDLPDGHELILTHHYYGIIADILQPIIVPMSSTNLKASQQLQALIGDQKVQVGGVIRPLPGFFKQYRLRTVYASNEQGNWYRWNPTVEQDNSDPVLRDFCKQFALACQRNEVEMSRPLEAAVAADVPI